MLQLLWSKRLKQIFLPRNPNFRINCDYFSVFFLLNLDWNTTQKTNWFCGSPSNGAAEMRTFLLDSLGGIWIVLRNRLTLIGREPHISRAPVCHSTDLRQLVGSPWRGRTLSLDYICVLVLSHLQVIAGFQGGTAHCVQCFSTELTWTFLLEQNDSHRDSWKSVFFSRRGAGGGLGEHSNDQHHGMRSRRAKPHLHFLNEDPQLQDTERGDQAAQKPAGLLCAEER